MLFRHIIENKRECKACGKQKLSIEFATASWKTLSSGERKHYRRRYCHKCYYLRVNKIKRVELRRWYNNIKSKMQCLDCGYDRYPRALEFHHVNNNKKMNVSDMIGHVYSKKTISEEMDKCITLCVRCHAERHYEGV